MALVDDNQVYEEDDADYPFENNFIDTPWDDRSKNSKIGIVALLVAILAVTVFCVCNSFIMHYATGNASRFNVDNTCPFINVNEKDNYNYVAKVYSISSKELLCVGAVLSSTAVLANKVCARDGPVHLVVGTSTDPRCKKGYVIDVDQITEIDHDGILPKKLIIIESKNNFAECGTPIPIGSNLNWKSPAYIIGRPLRHSGRALTKQPVTVFGKGNCSIPAVLSQKMEGKSVICVKDFGGCQVRAGDLLVQDGRLFGLAAAGVHLSGTTEAYFVDLTVEYSMLKIQK